ncbi:FecR family protein [Halopseudomonas salegens]|uniref:FecR family protein n=1 Tax=Halopseudomonas salegens TaxID=1434072 RepID=A0A1H2FAE0_9GAMM|nr:FecR domain-containing protein [Halopseudomonas salegens]SDU04309.1 FecR family protein [Halopseudomonas salegens]
MSEQKQRRLDAIPDAVRADAVAWLLDLQEADDPEQVERQISTWRSLDAAHELAWQQIEAVNARLRPLASGRKRQVAEAVLHTDNLNRRQFLKGSLGVVLLAGVGSLIGTQQPWLDWPADVFTGSGEQQRLELDNGTVITLGGQTALRHRLIGNTYQLHLLAGEILVRSAPADAEQRLPGYRTQRLEVLTNEVRVTPIGTRFSVRQQADATRVAVYQGRVATQVHDGLDAAELAAGEGAVFARNGLLRSDPPLRGEASWARGLVIAHDMPLHELLGIFNRHHEQQIDWAASVAALRVSGTYPLASQADVLSALTAILPIQVVSRPAGGLLIQPGE